MPTRISLDGNVQMAVVHDPNGVAVELIDLVGGGDDAELRATGLPSCAVGPGAHPR